MARVLRRRCALRNPTPPNPPQLEINKAQNTDLDERIPYMPFVCREEVGKWKTVVRYLGRYLVPRAVPRFSAGPTTSLGATTTRLFTRARGQLIPTQCGGICFLFLGRSRSNWFTRTEGAKRWAEGDTFVSGLHRTQKHQPPSYNLYKYRQI